MSENQRSENEVLKALEEQNKRRETLDSWRSKLEASLEHYQKEYEKLCREAKEQFGTANLEELREELRRRQEENQKALDNFTKQLDEQEAHLRSVQKVLDGVGSEEAVQ